MDNKTGLAPYVIRFSWVYAAFSIAEMLLVSLMQFSGNVGLTIAIVIASAFTAGEKFVKDHKRLLDMGERVRMTFFSLLLLALINIVLTLATLGLAGVDWGGYVGELMAAMIDRKVQMVAAIVVLVNSVALYVTYSLILNMIYKHRLEQGDV